MKVKSESEVAQSCLTLSDPLDCSPPGHLSMGFSRQEYWSGVPLPSSRDCIILSIYQKFVGPSKFQVEDVAAFSLEKT